MVCIFAPGCWDTMQMLCSSQVDFACEEYNITDKLTRCIQVKHLVCTVHVSWKTGLSQQKMYKQEHSTTDRSDFLHCSYSKYKLRPFMIYT